ncbi:hypothetical protein BGW39_003818, partial [Mortierella sp. 14UC]
APSERRMRMRRCRWRTRTWRTPRTATRRWKMPRTMPRRCLSGDLRRLSRSSTRLRWSPGGRPRLGCAAA